MHDFARAMRILRASRGWSQAQLAEVMGMHESSISRIDSGSRGLPTKRVPQICEIFAITPDIFFALASGEATPTLAELAFKSLFQVPAMAPPPEEENDAS